MRVLLSFEKDYRVYMEAVAEAIRTFHPNVEVVVADSEGLEAEVKRFDPHLVITCPPSPITRSTIGWAG